MRATYTRSLPLRVGYEMPIDSRGVDHSLVVAALDDLGIGDAWVVAARLRGWPITPGVEVADLPERTEEPVSAFRNQVVGRIAERVFRTRHLAALEPRFTIRDYHAQGENRDFSVEANGLELPINVKTASTIFRNARDFGLEPEDCIPISSYKALNAVDRVPDLVYVDLVDFALRQRTDAMMDALGGSLGIGWDLLSWYRGKGAKEAQDRFVDRLFEVHGAELDALAPGVANFRVISAQRVLAILRTTPGAAPVLG